MRQPDAATRLAALQPGGRCRLIMLQRWESLLFLHWRIAPERIQQTLPTGLTVDTFDGHAYLAIAPFFMRNVRPIGLPSVRPISNFQELNVRTYVFDREGVPGVWFYSLDCSQPLAVLIARMLTGLRYKHARMSSSRGDYIEYSSRRLGTADVAQYRYRPAGDAQDTPADSLEFFLLQRYYLFAQRAGSLVRGQVSHVPYRPRAAQIEFASAVPAHLEGFAGLPDAPDHVCFEEGFDVSIYALEKIA